MSESNRYSNLNTKPREQLKTRMDNFATFVWRGVRSWETYGAFIINNKNSLKFYNGPSFSNEYSKPKYSTTGSNLTGISFSTQTISFQIGAYWLTEEEYRELINWLSPYEISYLGFDFEDKYDYLVKLSKIGDSTRYIVGKNEQGVPVYYTELNLTFEVQGEACARRRQGYEFSISQDSTDKELLIDFDTEHDFIVSDLSFPFSTIISFLPKQNTDTLTLELEEKDSGEQLSLFSVEFQNLLQQENQGVESGQISVKAKKVYDLEDKVLSSPLNQNVSTNLINIRYDSESGLLFLNNGGDTEKLLNLITNIEGKRIISNLNAIKYKIPGKFINNNINYINYRFHLTLTNGSFNKEQIDENTSSYQDAVQISAYGRTNLI